MMNIKRYLGLVAVIGFISSTLANQSTNGIIGHKFMFDYGYTTYEITINSESELTWELVKGEMAGPVKETDNYIYTPIADGLIMISWVENSGFGLSNVLNLNTDELITHGRDGDTVFVNKGKITQTN